MAERRGGVWLRWWQLGVGAVALWVASPHVSTWAAGFVLPRANSARDLEQDRARRLVREVFWAGYTSELPPVTGEPGPVDTCRSKLTRAGLTKREETLLGGLTTARGYELDRVTDEMSARALQDAYAPSTINAVTHCVEYSFLSPLCVAVADGMVERESGPLRPERDRRSAKINAAYEDVCRTLVPSPAQGRS